jgi:Asp-tRNA(Asn)/Glu-tRNA(Gln) amidotransferase C subunit
MRDDSVTEGRIPREVLANAPVSVEGFYVVPKVID